MTWGWVDGGSLSYRDQGRLLYGMAGKANTECTETRMFQAENKGVCKRPHKMEKTGLEGQKAGQGAGMNEGGQM